MIDWENPETLVNASNQFTQPFTRDRSRAAVMCNVAPGY